MLRSTRTSAGTPQGGGDEPVGHDDRIASPGVDHPPQKLPVAGVQIGPDRGRDALGLSHQPLVTAFDDDVGPIDVGADLLSFGLEPSDEGSLDLVLTPRSPRLDHSRGRGR